MDASFDEMLYDPPAITDRTPVHDSLRALIELVFEIDRHSRRD